VHLRCVSLSRTAPEEPRSFPFDVPAIAALESLDLSSPVTFLVGENGSGKSTFLEALAWATESVAAGSSPLESDASLAAVRPLGRAMKLAWKRRTRRGLLNRPDAFLRHL
jgi:predicted ATPase